MEIAAEIELDTSIVTGTATLTAFGITLLALVVKSSSIGWSA
jgi:hypothetical protein